MKRKKFLETEYFKTQPSHLQDRLRRKVAKKKVKKEDSEESDVELIGKKPMHPRDLKKQLEKKW